MPFAGCIEHSQRIPAQVVTMTLTKINYNLDLNTLPMSVRY